MKLLNSKHSQTSIFIIIAILIVAIIVLFFVFKGNILNKEKIPVEVQPIYSFVENCIKQTGEDGVYQIGQTGGRSFNLDSLEEEFYYFDKGKNDIPSKDSIKEKIEDSIKTDLYFCVNDFEDFSNFKIKEDELKVEVLIESDKVILNVEYPLNVDKKENSYFIKNFKEIEILVRLGIIYDSANNIIQEQMNHPRDICITCITNMAVDNDLYIEIEDYNEEVVIFTIIDKNSKINGEDYIFKFANRYENE